MSLITCKNLRGGGGNSLKFRGKSEEVRVGGWSSSARVRGVFSFILSIVFSFVAIGSVLPASLYAEPAKIRVGTYNIRCIAKKDKGDRSWNDRRNDCFAHIRRLDLDVFGLQEVTARQRNEIEKNFPDYDFVGRSRGAKSYKGESVPVYYRKSRFNLEKSGTFWLSETPEVPGSKSWGTAIPRICTYVILKDKKSGKRLCFANTHTDHKSEEAREKGMLLVVKRMKDFGKGAPIVFVGDHNCCETDAPANAVSQILKDAIYLTKTPPKGPWRTFSAWNWRDREVSAVEALKIPKKVRNAKKSSPDADKSKNGGYDWIDCGAKIDFLYVSPDITVETYETFADPRPGKKCYHSDHFPIVCDIILKK